MGARKGSISYSLFHVDGEMPSDFRETFLEQIQEFAFRELTPEAEEDVSHGWSVMDDLLSVEFSKDNVFIGEYLCLGMRNDRWALPGALLKAHVERRIDEVKREHDKTKLFRSEKVAIREEVTRQLKHRTLPAAAVVDMVWTVDRREVRFWSQSNRSLELFESLFESTFGLRLVPNNAYIAALNCGLSDTLIGALAGVEQAQFTSFE
ncbi:MAG: DNA recombination-dependent growth factor C [Bradymonadia bacterium]|jgi:DNA recombination-dependent growth factor C